jgi:biopolymer transport protein ExbD
MAEIIQEEKGKDGKKKTKKHPPHIDMTPMVDLMCLLIVFFMLTTAFNKAKIMEIVLPEKLKDINQEAPKISASRTQNIILGPENRIFYYPGTVKPENFNNLPPLRESDFSATGIRQILLGWNRTLFKRIDDFNLQVLKGEIDISQDSVQGAIRKLKNDDDTGPIVLIKAYKQATYGNFVDILDEMNICGVAHYMFVDIAWYEEDMVEAAVGTTSGSTTGTSSD